MVQHFIRLYGEMGEPRINIDIIIVLEEHAHYVTTRMTGPYSLRWTMDWMGQHPMGHVSDSVHVSLTLRLIPLPLLVPHPLCMCKGTARMYHVTHGPATVP
jgi:hypothetical protein